MPRGRFSTRLREWQKARANERISKHWRPCAPVFVLPHTCVLFLEVWDALTQLVDFNDTFRYFPALIEQLG